MLYGDLHPPKKREAKIMEFVELSELVSEVFLKKMLETPNNKIRLNVRYWDDANTYIGENLQGSTKALQEYTETNITWQGQRIYITK